MNSPTLSSADTHSELVLLLPWYVNQTLSSNEHQLVERHLKSCLICRRELLNLRKLSAAVQGAADLDMAADASLAGLRMKMQQAGDSRPMPSSLFAQSASRGGKGEQTANGLSAKPERFWTRFGNTGKGLAIAASLLLVMAPVALNYLPLSTTGDYYTLADARPDSRPVGQLRVVFTKTMPPEEIDRLLRGINAVRVDGPNSMGAYTINLTVSEREQALALLRGRQDVILAEPIIQP